ncbi:uncharacterized protein PAC_09849 [Phialocephala subalpina]|uniref:Uncharacterized protein n=1 Tax=Phialocephala subalpina TaxID=576137 RepID=A0A1L7X4L2_9HELO|nr:uncharacterized protein PAC_09849 [Phialocephala subalpina]
MLHTGTSSTSNLSLDSSSSSEQEGLISTCLPIPASLMGVSECRAKTALESTVKLTEAGPQFLVFLERYGWQVETRWAVFLKHQQDTGTIKEGEEDEQEDTAEEVDEEDGEVKMGGKEEERIVFEFMIGNYCVKKFLEDAERDLTSFKSLAAFPSTPAIKVKEKFKVKVKERFRRKEKVEKKKEVTEAVPAPRKMFGEIEKAPTIAVEKDSWVKGILWYHGLRFGAESEAVEQDLVTGSDETAKIKSKSKGRSCMNSVNVGMKKVGSSMGHWFRRLRCGGDFQSLDD